MNCHLPNSARAWRYSNLHKSVTSLDKLYFHQYFKRVIPPLTSVLELTPKEKNYASSLLWHTYEHSYRVLECFLKLISLWRFFSVCFVAIASLVKVQAVHMPYRRRYVFTLQWASAVFTSSLPFYQSVSKIVLQKFHALVQTKLHQEKWRVPQEAVYILGHPVSHDQRHTNEKSLKISEF